MASDGFTHAPVRNGTLCGKFPVPNDARDYDPNNPTCETCSRRLKDAQRNSARIMANAAIAARAADAAAALPPPSPRAKKAARATAPPDDDNDEQ